MDTVGVNSIETAALGRPFQLGMLYDCRKDALIPGITLWDQEKLQQSLRVRPQINTDFKVTASDSIEDKSNLLNIDGSLKLSVLGGLVNVEGSAKYLNDTKKSFRQQRLTLHYHSSSRFEELSMNHLAPENISHHEVFDKDTATHVVTAVLYGADACFVFDREVSSDEEIKIVEGEAKVAFEKLKLFSVNVNVNLKMNDTQKNAVQKFTCTFHGDFQLPSNPTTLEDALKVFTDLPKLLGEKKELAVPLRVWLYPLSKLHTRASKLQKDISMYLIMKTESVIECLNTTEMKCNDLLEDSPALTFAEFHDKILQMKQNCYMYKLRLMKKLGSLLPNIRGDVKKETDLNDLLQEHDKSPFSERDLVEWLKERERESDVIKLMLRQLKDARAQVEVNIDLISMDLKAGNVVCYTFTSLNWSDVLLYKQKDYLSNSTTGETDEKNPDSEQKSLAKKYMKSKIFKNSIDSEDRKPRRFTMSLKKMKNNPLSWILLGKSECDEASAITGGEKGGEVSQGPQTLGETSAISTEGDAAPPECNFYQGVPTETTCTGAPDTSAMALDEVLCFSPPKQKSWLTPDVKKTMKSNLKIFKNLIYSEDCEPAKFIVSSKEMENNPGSCILLYESECDEAVCFIPPSKPACPIIEEVKDNSVVLKVPPSCPATVELRLLYKLKQDTVWRSKPVMKDENTVTLTDLRAGTEYEIKWAALGKLNYTVYSDVISITTKRRNRSVMEYCGLINQGSTSYLNAVLQTLYMTQEYREGVMRLERREDSSDGNLKESKSDSDHRHCKFGEKSDRVHRPLAWPKIWYYGDSDSDSDGDSDSDFTEELKSLFNKLDKESHPVSTAGISKSLGIKNVYRHKDAAEYLRLILQKTPEASEIFKVKVKKTGTCSSCKRMASEQSDFFTLMIYPTQTNDVESALRARIDEMRKDLRCRSCYRPPVENINSHFDFPQRLILQLRNFQNKAIITGCIEVSTHKYEPYAIINLYGTFEEGHYNADIKSDNGKWYRCDDSHVFQDPNEMLSESRWMRYIWPGSKSCYSCRGPHAYLVLYKRSISA